MNRSASSSNANAKKLAITTAIVLSILITIPSCKIPDLRCALRGPGLPESYHLGNGQNRGSSLWGFGAANVPAKPADSDPKSFDSENPSDDKDEEDKTDVSSDDVASDTKNGGGPFHFAGFIKPAKSPDLNALDNINYATPDAGQTANNAQSKSTKSKGLVSSFKLANFIKPVSSLDLEASDSASDKETTSPVNETDTTSKSSDSTNGTEALPPAAEPIQPIGIVGSSALDPGIVSFENSAQIPWCDFFNDPYLTGLIGQAISGNQELRILNEEIQVANNEVQARRGAYLPFFSLGAGAGLEKSSRFTRAGAVEDQLTAAPGKGFPDPLPNFLLATNVSWEIDIWRRLRNSRDAASLRYLGTVDGRNFTITRLVAEVAENYYGLLSLDSQMVTLENTIKIQEQSLEAAKNLKAAGRGTELGVQRFQAEVRKNQSELLIIQQDIVEAENRINFLLGRYPQTVERLSVDYLNLNLQTLAAGVPSQLLRNRADIRQAERELMAAGLDVRVARARFYPALILSAGVGYQAFNPKYIFDSPESLIYNVAGDLVAPVINRKAIKAEYMTANSRQLQAVYEYQRTILTAFTEVINYMNKVDNYAKSIEIKKQQLDALQSSVENATNLFQNARAEYIEVLLSQRDLMEARMVTIETKQEQLSAVVNAYQALGGGGLR